MKNIIKFTFIFMMLFIISIVTSIIRAETYNVNDKIDLGQYNMYYRQGGTYVNYCGRPQPNFMYFYKDYNNVEHKAFCLNLGLSGAENGEYLVDVNQIISDPKVASILISGSPYKTLSELGLNDEDEASFATQFALWIYQNNLDINAITPCSPNNQNVVEAIKKIYYDGMNMNYTSEAILGVDKVGKADIDNVDREYYSQRYNISHNGNIKNISLSLMGVDNLKVTDINNNEISNINNVNEFKILIPRTSIDENKNIKLNFRTQANQTSVMFGATTKNGFQDMGLLLDPVNFRTVQSNFDVEYKTMNITLNKIDKDTKEGIKGVTFKFETLDGKELGKYITGENGIIQLDVQRDLKLFKEQKIKVTEIEVPDNYYIDEENCSQIIDIKWGENTTIEFQNEKIKGNIKVVKLSSEDNKYTNLLKRSPLKDVEFEILDVNGKVLDKIKTNEEGIAVTKDLLKGKYYIKEIKQAKYYLLNKKIYEVEIVNHKDLIEQEILNDSVDIDIEIEKKGFIETQNKDNIYYNFKNIHNKSNVSLDNFTWNDILPTDAVRLDKIYTGTWNEKLKYSVWYKTNKSDFIMYIDKLDSEKVYELDFNNLELKEDEYITEFEFRFGTVQSDFMEVESPIVYVNVLNDLKNGFTFTNNTRVSGNYLDEYIEDKDKWTTIIYNKRISKNKELPKTGK